MWLYLQPVQEPGRIDWMGTHTALAKQTPFSTAGTHFRQQFYSLFFHVASQHKSSLLRSSISTSKTPVFCKTEKYLLMYTHTVWKLKQKHDCLPVVAVVTMGSTCPDHTCLSPLCLSIPSSLKVQKVPEVEVIITHTMASY